MTESTSKYEQYRNHVEHEDNLINHRVSWLLIAQSFLLGACVAKGVYPWIVISFGIVSTILTYLSILAAIMALRTIKKKIEADDDLKDHKPLVISTGKIFFCGVIGAYTVPVAFLIVWILAAIFPPSS